MLSDRPSLARIGRALAYVLPVMAPLVLLANLDLPFREDWPNHLWAVDYYGRYLRAHHEFPSCLNSASSVGIALPLFYAWLLYPLLGTLSVFIGADLAVRLAVFALTVLTFRIVLRAARQLTGERGVAYVIAISVIWATYALTNLYNRGALAEYFATGFLSVAAAFGALACAQALTKDRRFNSWMTGLFALLAAGTHPPTALLGGAFIVLLVLAGACSIRAGAPGRVSIPWLPLIAIVAAGLVILAPWLYASAIYSSKLGVTHGIGALTFFPDRSDSLIARLAPFPIDFLSVQQGWEGLSTPYLETPVSFALLGLLAWNLIVIARSARARSVLRSPAFPIVAASVLWFSFLLVLSVSPNVAAPFAWLAPYVQMVYRFVGHANLALFVGVLASGALAREHQAYARFRRGTELMVAVGITVGILALGMKVLHAIPPESFPPKPPRLDIGIISQTYDTPALVRELTRAEQRASLTANLSLTVTGDRFGELEPRMLQLREASWVVTNIVPFPWGHLTDGGYPIPATALARIDQRLAVHLPAGKHTLVFHWQPTRAWLALRTISYAVFAVVLLASLAWALAACRPSPRDEPVEM